MELKRRKFPNHLRKFRKQMGLTQLEVAALLKLASSKHIILWEKGKSHPGMCNFFKLCIIYNVHAYELYPECYHELREELLTMTENLLLQRVFLNNEAGIQ